MNFTQTLRSLLCHTQHSAEFFLLYTIVCEQFPQSFDHINQTECSTVKTRSFC